MTIGVPCLRRDCEFNEQFTTKTYHCSRAMPEIIPLTLVNIQTGETNKYAICKYYGSSALPITVEEKPLAPALDLCKLPEKAREEVIKQVKELLKKRQEL